jgi:hypothetical protein
MTDKRRLAMVSKKSLLFTLLTLLLSSTLSAQPAIIQDLQRQSDSFSAYKWRIFPIPILYYTPETRFVIGGAVYLTFRFKNDSVNSKPSQIGVLGTYSQNKQVLFYIPFQLFPNNGNQFYSGEIGYFRYNYFYYGFGQRHIKGEYFGVDFPRINIKAVQRVKKSIYAGGRFQFEDYKITKINDGGDFDSGLVPYGRGSTSVGLGLVTFFDKRDFVFYPTKGYTMELGWTSFQKEFGGTVTFNRYNFDFTNYVKLSSKIIQANNVYINHTIGEVPFNLSTTLGGVRRLRGYYEGYYRDYNTILLQTESRYKFNDYFGAVVFGSVGFLGNNTSQLIRLNDSKYSYGVGGRLCLDQKNKQNIRLDLGFNHLTWRPNVYFTIGEAF